ncbi:MAG: hypothetical protein DRP01_00010 [Archaeoglobales archaeon]|nr:MAG: hypothetical protein DRP01_00010 [Archaeoglobales archaeon]
MTKEAYIHPAATRGIEDGKPCIYLSQQNKLISVLRGDAVDAFARAWDHAYDVYRQSLGRAKERND